MRCNLFGNQPISLCKVGPRGEGVSEIAGLHLGLPPSAGLQEWPPLEALPCNVHKPLAFRASPPCRVKGSWQALWRGLGEKTCPTPLPSHSSNCQGSSNFRLHSPSSRVSIAPCCARISGSFWPQPLVLRLTRNILGTFSIWRDRKQLTMGECHGKKIGCKLGALQRAFREPAFLRQGGDALSPLPLWGSFFPIMPCLWGLTYHICKLRVFDHVWCPTINQWAPPTPPPPINHPPNVPSKARSLYTPNEHTSMIEAPFRKAPHSLTHFPPCHVKPSLPAIAHLSGHLATRIGTALHSQVPRQLHPPLADVDS